MKKILWALLSILSLSTIFSFTFYSNTVKIKLHLQEGDVYNYHLQTNQNSTVKVDGKEMKTTIQLGRDMEFKVEEEYERDSFLLQVSFKHIDMNINAMGHELSFDSDHSQGEGYSKLFQAMEKDPIDVSISSSGDILGIRRADKLLHDLKAASSFHNQKLAAVMNKMITKENFKSQFYSFKKFPNHAVSVGDHWQKSYPFHSVFDMTFTLTYTVKKILPNKILLDIKGDVKQPQEIIQLHGQQVPAKISLHQTGQYEVNRHSGLVSSGHTNETILVQMNPKQKEVTIQTKGTTTFSTDKKN